MAIPCPGPQLAVLPRPDVAGMVRRGPGVLWGRRVWRTPWDRRHHRRNAAAKTTAARARALRLKPLCVLASQVGLRPPALPPDIVSDRKKALHQGLHGYARRYGIRRIERELANPSPALRTASARNV